MKFLIQNCFFVRLAIATIVPWTASSATAQKVVVDADPAHVANTFSPVRSLGAAIDRLRTGTPDKLMHYPLLKEILGAARFCRISGHRNLGVHLGTVRRYCSYDSPNCRRSVGSS